MHLDTTGPISSRPLIPSSTTTPSQQETQHQDQSSIVICSPTTTRAWIWSMLVVYVVLILLLFTWPRHALRNYTGDGLGAIAIGMEIVFLTYGSALVVSLLALVITYSKWHAMDKNTKIAGLFPISSWIVIFIVVWILSILQEIPEDPCFGPNATDYECPKRKNITNVLFLRR